MKLSWNWLRRLAALDGITPDAAARLFTTAVAEIDGVHLPPSRADLASFKIARILAVAAHPRADRLRVCSVDAGGGAVQVVCGAPNARAGLLSILALPGTVVQGTAIRAGEIRGVLSGGMLCSEKELGLGEDHAGILELMEGQPGEGADVAFAAVGPVLELDNKAVTHRPDLWGHHGVARELAALFNVALREPELATLPTGLGDGGFTLKVEEPDLCRRYCGLLLKGIEVKPSPLWMQRLLTEAGQRPINNVVDATNFVMLELAQPTHAFDVLKLPAREIRVRRAGSVQPFRTLTGRDIELAGEELVIAIGDWPQALAGVVGGEASAVGPESQEIFLEAAHFDPVAVRRAAARHDLRSESSARFEKSLDPENAPRAIRRIVQLLSETCPRLEVASKLLDAYPRPYPPLVIEFEPGLVTRKLGVEIQAQRQSELLRRLGFEVEEMGRNFAVRVPSWRNTRDINGAIDLVEEIGRLHGFDKITPTPPLFAAEPVGLDPAFLRARRVRAALVQRGFDETMTYSFTSRERLADLDALEAAVELKNPLSREHVLLRTTLLATALDVWRENAKSFDAFRAFELGRVFHARAGGLPAEREELIAAIYGGESAVHELRAVALELLAGLTSAEVEVRNGPSSGGFAHVLAHPARSARLLLAGREIGAIAELHPARARALDLRGRLAFLVLRDPLALESPTEARWTGIERFPSVPFSVSLIAPERTPVGEILGLLGAVDGQRVRDVRWEGNYSGAPIPTGQVSMTFSLRFRHPERTLDGAEIAELQKRVVQAAAAHGYCLRGP